MPADGDTMAISSRRWTMALVALTTIFSLPLSVAAQEASAVGSGAADQICGDGIAIPLPGGGVACSHGDDPAPPGADPLGRRMMAPFAASPTVECITDGTDGVRVQALYVVAADRPNRAATVVPKIRQWITEVDQIFSESSSGHGTDLVVRWVHDSACAPVVETVVVPAAADDTFQATIAALDKAGYGKPGRHYLAWVDADVYCGIAVNYLDDSPGEGNYHNGDYPLWGRIDTQCWGISGMVEAHELSHMLGAVQASAPNSSGHGHCTDEYDIMCYVDAPGVEMRVVCGDTGNEYRLDCNNDDYFDPDPAAGSYLDTHWNIARSAFLHERSAATPTEPVSPDSPPIGFFDVATSHPFAAEIDWLAAVGITKGCNPPANDEFCPESPVTRGQMAAFLVRGLGLGDADGDHFADDDSSVLEGDINRLATARITAGCGDRRFCPGDTVTRGQMAAFLARALGLPAAGTDFFADDAGSVFEADINRLAAAGITTGCGEGRYCLNEPLTRGQMAAFLKRALPNLT